MLLVIILIKFIDSFYEFWKKGNIRSFNGDYFPFSPFFVLSSFFTFLPVHYFLIIYLISSLSFVLSVLVKLYDFLWI